MGDMQIMLDWNSWEIDLFHVNAEYVMGRAAEPKKHRFGPTGSKMNVCDNLALNFMAKRSRWNQLGLKPGQMAAAAVVDFIELKKQGFSFTTVLRAWSKSMARDTGYVVGLNVLKKLKPMFSEHVETLQMPKTVIDFLVHIYRVDVTAFPFWAKD